MPAASRSAGTTTRGRSQASASVGREPSAGKPRRSVRERCAHLKRTGAPCVLPAQTRLPAPNSARSEQTTAYGVNTHENLRGAAVIEVPETRYTKSGDVSIAYQV